MNTLEFLKRVLPSSGVYFRAVIANGQVFHHWFESVEHLAEACLDADKQGQNTYYAISAYKEEVKSLATKQRTAENVSATKVIALDIDCGEKKPYADAQEAIAELEKFVTDKGLPQPMVVFSGGGLHVYFLLSHQLPPEEWVPIATAMKSAALNSGLGIDKTITGDRARILRPINTNNPKHDKKVLFICDGVPTDPIELQKILDTVEVPKHIIQGAKPTSSIGKAIIAGTEYAPALPTNVLKGCEQVRWAVENQEEVDEPLWYRVLGIAAFCENPENTAIMWSSEHSYFSEAETLKKMSQWADNATGPPTCEWFKDSDSEKCKNCAFAGKITSPVQIGARFEETPMREDAPDPVAKEIEIPFPYKRVKISKTEVGIAVPVGEGELKTDKLFMPFDLFPVSYGKDEGLGYEVVSYQWWRQHHGWQPLVFRQALLTEAAEQEFAKTIADQGIVLKNKGDTKLAQAFMRNYMQRLRNDKALSNVYATMGWKNDETLFVIGDAVIRKNEEGHVVEEESMMSSNLLSTNVDMFSLGGELMPWCDLTKVLEEHKLFGHMFILGVALSAPLYHFTGLKGITISLYGDTGGGKTLAQYWAQSIYGNPDKLHYASEYTLFALFDRLGTHNNLPMTVDEITQLEDKHIGKFCYWVSQGRDRQRLNQRAQAREAKTWQTPVIVSTNKSLQSKLIASGEETDAQMARLLELHIFAREMFKENSDFGKYIYREVHKNYGHAGRLWIKNLMKLGIDEIEKRILAANDEFSKKYGVKFTGQERYWEQSIVLAELSMRMAKEQGIIKFNYEEAIQWVLNEVESQRKVVKDNRLSTYDIISEYMTDHASSRVTMFYTVDRTPMVNDSSLLPRNGIRIRLNLYRNGEKDPFHRGIMMFDRSHFRKWLSSKGIDYGGFIKTLEENQLLAQGIHNTRMSLGKNTPISESQKYVLALDLTHERLQDLLEPFGDTVTKAEAAGVIVIEGGEGAEQ